jgi:hypothetical protein
MNNSQKEKEKTTVRVRTTYFRALAISAVILLSSIAAAQLLVTNDNAALAQSSGIIVSGTCDNYPPEQGPPEDLQVLFTVQGAQPNTFYYYTEIEESTGRVIDSSYYDNYDSYYTTSTTGTLGETYTLSWYQDFDGDYNDVGIEENELVASDSVTCGESPPPPPPPIDLTVSINPTGTVNSRTGEVTLSGTLECSQDAEIIIVADLSQRAGRVIISGSMVESISCTAGGDPIEWTGTLSGNNGRFVAGRADVHVAACDQQSGVGDDDQVSTTVQLRGSR